MSDDLFAALAPPPPRVIEPPAHIDCEKRCALPSPPRTWPGVPVASFACVCGARDEVIEPAPATVDCWSCKVKLGMARWHPLELPPSGNARSVTDAERSRIAIARDAN